MMLDVLGPNSGIFWLALSANSPNASWASVWLSFPEGLACCTGRHRTLLNRVGQLMGEEIPTRIGSGGVGALGEEDVALGRERVGTERAAEPVSGSVVMDPNASEVSGEATFEVVPHVRLDGLSVLARPLDRPLHAGVERAAGRAMSRPRLHVGHR